MIDPRINTTPQGFDPETGLPPGFLEFILPLHSRFTPRQQALAAKRREVLIAAHAGTLPNHLPPSEATEGDWHIDLPGWCQDQRNQMTGPADDAELVVKMLNSGAPGVMLDLEDSTANFWANTMLGHQQYTQGAHGRTNLLRPEARRRGIHQAQRHRGVDPPARSAPEPGRHVAR